MANEEYSKKEQPKSHSERILHIPSGWTDNRWKQLGIILDTIENRLAKIEQQLNELRH